MDFVVVAPDDPLCLGLVDLLREKGIRVESLAIIDNLDDCKITVR